MRLFSPRIATWWRPKVRPAISPVSPSAASACREEWLEARDGEDAFSMVCRSSLERMRIETFASKETGTNAWIRRHVKPGQVFCDIGANIGLYTLLAAKYVGTGGTVYAFEPHLLNCAGLLANVAANRLKNVRVCSLALHQQSGFFDFQYSSLDAGTAFNQLITHANATGPTAAASEVKAAVAFDDLIAQGVCRPPQHVKLDVDGNELLILKGMSHYLTHAERPLTLQVEIDPPSADSLHAFLRSAGYQVSHRHDTASGKTAIAGGANPNDVPHNVIFLPAQ